MVPNSTGLKYDTAKKMNEAAMAEAERQGLTTEGGAGPSERSRGVVLFWLDQWNARRIIPRTYG